MSFQRHYSSSLIQQTGTVLATNAADCFSYGNVSQLLYLYTPLPSPTVTTAVMVPNVFVIKNACSFGYKRGEREKEKEGGAGKKEDQKSRRK